MKMVSRPTTIASTPRPSGEAGQDDRQAADLAGCIGLRPMALLDMPARMPMPMPGPMTPWLRVRLRCARA